MKFLVIGDEMVDRYYCGRISRLNPEKRSAPLLAYDQVVERPGGAANVAANLAAMRVEVVLVSQSFGIIVKNRLLDDADGVIARFDSDGECSPASLDKISEAAGSCCAAIVSDYGKGAIDSAVVERVKSLGIPTFADVKVRPDLWADWCAAMFPNKDEFLRHRVDYLSSPLCVVKCGARGAMVYRRGTMFISHFPSSATRVANVAGAGDTAVAAFVAAYMALGMGPRDWQRVEVPLRIAMDFAAAAVANPLTAAPTFAGVYDPLPTPWPDDVVRMASRLREP